MNTIKVKNTKKLSLAGEPSKELIDITNVDKISISPSLISFIKPKLFVKKGDEVKSGTRLFFDKQDDNLVFISPVSGTIEDIVYGPKRVIENIIIKLQGDEKEDINHIDTLNLQNKSSDEIREFLIENGLWFHIREFPFLNITPTNKQNLEYIYITLEDDEPHKPKADVYLSEYKDEFLIGLNCIKQLFKNVYVGSCENHDTKQMQDISQIITHNIKGNYPANQPGSFLYYDKTSTNQNNASTINPQAIIKIGYLIKHKCHLSEKIITASGNLLKKPTHLKIKEGTQISKILQHESFNEDIRVVVGGLLSGRKSSLDGYINYDEYAISVLSEDIKQDLFGFFRLGFNKYTFSRAYASSFLPKTKKIEFDTSLYGEVRNCISCAMCPDVCPVELYPQEIIKNLGDKRTNEALELGMLDCINCGLCTFTCPSKIEIASIITTAKMNFTRN